MIFEGKVFEYGEVEDGTEIYIGVMYWRGDYGEGKFYV